MTKMLRERGAGALIALILVLSVFCLPFAATADTPSGVSDAHFGVVGASGAVGKEIETFITINENTHIGNFTLLINYDPAVLEFVSCNATDVALGGMCEAMAHPDEQQVRIAYIVINPLVDAGNLFLVRWKVLANNATELTLDMKECDGYITVDGKEQSFRVNYTLGSATINAGSPSPVTSVVTTQATTPVQTTKATDAKTTASKKPQESKTTKFHGGGSVSTNQRGEPFVIVTEPGGAMKTDANGKIVTSYIDTAKTSVVTVTNGDGTVMTNSDGTPVTEVVLLEAAEGSFPYALVIAIAAGVLALVIALIIVLKQRKKAPQADAPAATGQEAEATGQETEVTGQETEVTEPEAEVTGQEAEVTEPEAPEEIPAPTDEDAPADTSGKE